MAAGGKGERPLAFQVETLAVAAARPQLVALDFPPSAERLVIGPLCPLVGRPHRRRRGGSGRLLARETAVS